MNKDSGGRRKGILGNVDKDYWIYDSEDGFDLTRPIPPTAGPRANAITLKTGRSDIAIDPSISALVIIDMQSD